MIKKIYLIVFVIFLLTNINLYSKENLSIQSVFNLIDKNDESYEKRLYNISQKKIENSFQKNKLGDFNGINFSSNFNMVENFYENNEKRYKKNLQNRLSYGPFFLNYNSVESKNNYVSYGIEKNLKDIFYSPYKSNLRVDLLNKNLNKLHLKREINNKKINFLNLYKDLVDTQNELIYRKKAKEYYEIEIKKMKKMFDLGMESKINVEAIEIELEENNFKLEFLSNKEISLYEIIKNLYNLDLNNYKLENISVPQVDDIDYYVDRYSNLELNEIEFNMNILEEEEKYLKYDNFMPDLIFSFERIDKNDINGRVYKGQNIFSLRFSKKLFSSEKNYKDKVLEKEKIVEDLKQKEIDIENQKLKLYLELENLEKNVKINQKKLDIFKKKYEIKKKEYELKRLSYLDVIDEYNKYLMQEIETSKSRNELAVFIYELIIKGE